MARIFGSVNLVSMRESNAKGFLPNKSGPFAFKPRIPPSKAGHGESPTSGHCPTSSRSSEHSELSSDGDSIFDSDYRPSGDETDETDDDEPSINYFPGSSEVCIFVNGTCECSSSRAQFQLYHPSTVINNHFLRTVCTSRLSLYIGSQTL